MLAAREGDPAAWVRDRVREALAAVEPVEEPLVVSGGLSEPVAEPAPAVAVPPASKRTFEPDFK
jgi:hypothetical protein